MAQNRPLSEGEDIQSIHYWRGRLKQVEARNAQLEQELDQERQARRHWQKKVRELEAYLERIAGPMVTVSITEMSAAVSNLAGAVALSERARE